MHLIDNQQIVSLEGGIARNFLQQDPIGHHFESGRRRHSMVKSGLASNPLPELLAAFMRNARGDRAGGEPSRLRMPDARVGRATQT